MEFRLTRIGIFAATRWESQAIQCTLSVEEVRRHAGYRCVIGRRGACQVLLVQTGMGPQRARTACRTIFREHRLDLAVSSGLACALTDSSIGDLFIGTEIVPLRSPAFVEHPIVCDNETAALILRLAHVSAMPARAGRFVSVPRIIWRADEKRRLADETGGLALDMESGAIGSEAAAHRIPFAIIRAASDLLDENLPLDFNLFLAPRDWPKGVWSCIVRPAHLIGLSHLRKHMQIASQRLTAIFGQVLDELGCRPSSDRISRVVP